MEPLFTVLPAFVAPITISPNGNSPEIKMIGGMMVDTQNGFVPMTPSSKSVETTTKTNYEKSKKLNTDSTKLSLNERYRRLIPYMTFYYANDLSSTTEAYSSKDVEVEKAEIVEARMIQQNQRDPKKLVYAPHWNIPRYQGNRLTQFNIASSNPTKVYYKQVPVYQNALKVTPNYNPLLSKHIANHDYNNGRIVQKPIVKAPSVPFAYSPRKPFSNLHSNEDSANVQYYSSNRDQPPRYKLVPYEQSRPANVVSQSETVFEAKNPVAVPISIPKEPVYIRPRPARPQYLYDNGNLQQVIARKPAVVSENYYEKRRLPVLPQPVVQPIIEDGFKPIVGPVVTTEGPVYTTISPVTPISHFESAKKPAIQIVEAPIAPEVDDYRPNYYQYVVEQPTYKPEEYEPSKTVSLSDLLNSLQLNKSIPKPITRDNVGSSIRTLLQVLNALKVMSHHNDVEASLINTPKPYVAQVVVEVTAKPELEATAAPVDVELHQEPYLAPVNTPSQHLDDFPTGGGTSQRFPPPVQSDDEGGTPGKPGVDYPTLSTIPPTSFDCKTQRYKGFFADPDTKCQVWHYCDLNGGQASFLCPNGTIFSQAALTCDWWFNVRCASTTQLYVLNESLYKYILPHSPKFPEDYSGPLVDKYLTLKFKEMEEQFKKNKNKQSASDKVDSDETDIPGGDGGGDRQDSAISEHIDRSDDTSDVNAAAVSEASVMVESPGTSGNVERLQD